MNTTMKTQINLSYRRKFDKYLLHERKVLRMNKNEFDRNYEERTRRFLMKTIKPNWHVVELGAGIGFQTLTMAKNAEHVFAYENDLNNLSELRKNISTFQNITLIPSIVSEVSGVMNFNLNASPLANKRDLRVLNRRLFLDKQVAKCDFIRINTDGRLMDVITGANNLILRCYPILLIERKPKDILEVLYILKISGYKFFRIKPNGKLRKVEGVSDHSTVAIFNKN